MNNFRILFSIFIIIIISSCKNSIEFPDATPGSADLSKYVSIGGSYTAGYTDEALYLEGQQNSYPFILASSFASAGGGTFKQPLVNEGVGMGIYYNAKYILSLTPYSCSSETYFKAVAVASAGDASVFTNQLSSTLGS